MTTSTPTIYMGLDPGFDRLGWAVGRWENKQWQQLDYGCLITDPEQTIFERYQQLQHDLAALLAEFSPDVAGVETLFFSANRTTALRVSETRGLIISELLRAGVEIQELNPNQIKLAVTGDGHADKAAVAKMVRLGLQLGEQSIIDDAMDALAGLMTCQATYALTHNRPTSTT